MEGYADYNIPCYRAYTIGRASSLGILGQRRSQGVRRIASHGRKRRRLYGTLRKSRRRKVYFFDPKTDTWQEKEGLIPVMPTISGEWLQRLIPVV